jgi:hypothetical protein
MGYAEQATGRPESILRVKRKKICREEINQAPMASFFFHP